MDSAKSPVNEGSLKNPDSDTIQFVMNEMEASDGYKHFVLSDGWCDEKLWKEHCKTITLIGIKERPLDEIVTAVKSLLDNMGEDITPARMTAMIFQDSLNNFNLQDLFKMIDGIVECVRANGRHKIAFSTCHFVPGMENLWQKVGQLNQYLREVNMKLGNNPLNLHKAVMKHTSGSGNGLKVRQSLWTENPSKKPVFTLSNEGMAKCFKFLINFHLHGFNDKDGAHKKGNTEPLHMYPKQAIIKHFDDLRTVINFKRKIEFEENVKKREEEMKKRKKSLDEEEAELDRREGEIKSKNVKLDKKLKKAVKRLAEVDEQTQVLYEAKLYCEKKQSNYEKKATDYRNKMVSLELEIAQKELELSLLKKESKENRFRNGKENK